MKTLRFSIAALLVCTARVASAEEPLVLHYEKTEDAQPDARTATEILRRRVKAVAATDDGSRRAVGTIRLESRKGECVAFAELKQPPYEGERLLRAPTCEQALEALGVSLSILINEVAQKAAEPEPAPPEPAATPQELEAPPNKPRAHLGVGFRGGLDRGFVPGGFRAIGVGGAIEIFLRNEFAPRWETELGWRKQLDSSVYVALNRPTYSDVAGDVSAWSAAARLCRLSAGAEVAVLLRGCARLEIVDQTFSRTSATGDGTDTTKTGVHGAFARFSTPPPAVGSAVPVHVPAPPSMPLVPEPTPVAPPPPVVVAPRPQPLAAAPPQVRSAPAPLPADRELEREMAQVSYTRSLVEKRQYADALQAIAAYRANLGKVLEPEVRALEVEATFGLGKTGEGKRLAESFLADYPRHPAASRVKALLEL